MNAIEKIQVERIKDILHIQRVFTPKPEIEKSVFDEFEPEDDTIEKGIKVASTGEVRIWGGKKMRKQPNGKWIEVSEHGLSKKEHEQKADYSDYEANNQPHENVQRRYQNHADSQRELASKLSDKEYGEEELSDKKEIGASLVREVKAQVKKYLKQSIGPNDADFEFRSSSNELLLTVTPPSETFLAEYVRVHFPSAAKKVGATYIVFDLNKFNTQSDIIEKGGKPASAGEVRVWNGKKMRKQPNGKWVEISVSHGLSKKEHEESSKGKVPAYKEGDGVQALANQEYAHRKNYEHKDSASKLSDKEYSDEELTEVERLKSGKGDKYAHKFIHPDKVREGDKGVDYNNLKGTILVASKNLYDMRRYEGYEQLKEGGYTTDGKQKYVAVRTEDGDKRVYPYGSEGFLAEPQNDDDQLFRTR